MARELILVGRRYSAKNTNYRLQKETCDRCGGSGTYPSSCYNGICLKCNGPGQVLRYVATPEWQAVLDERREKREAKKAAARAEKAAKLAAERQARIAALPAWVMGVALFAAFADDIIARSVIERLVERDKPMTDKQAAAIFRSALKFSRVKHPVVEGKAVVISGKIISTREQDNRYGYGSIIKMLVADDRGFKVWGTRPNTEVEDVDGWIINDEGKRCRTLDTGDRVTFTAGVERSRDDEFFGFFKRPRKVTVLG